MYLLGETPEPKQKTYGNPRGIGLCRFSASCIHKNNSDEKLRTPTQSLAVKPSF
ncbi:hypothetical protein FUAX_37220 [Fulvitalea axinellae]|uniref:Uncharacterized protein n=1 Tax=Fulvitalea axinellae TaxID=1182444 RepID=A0AAU9DJC0_9BACT|nr:hypothetical protein FUAX_37220 [Fulvitalea axinellae]